jgi:hypothetical protein
MNAPHDIAIRRASKQKAEFIDENGGSCSEAAKSPATIVPSARGRKLGGQQLALRGWPTCFLRTNDGP